MRHRGDEWNSHQLKTVVTLIAVALALFAFLAPGPISIWGSNVLLMLVAPGFILWCCRRGGHLGAPIFWVPVALGLFVGALASSYTTSRLLRDLEPETPTRAILVAVALTPAAVAAVAALGPSVRHAMRFRVLGAGELFVAAIVIEIWVAMLLASETLISPYLIWALHVGCLCAVVLMLVQFARSPERPEGLACLAWFGVCFLAVIMARFLVDLDADPRAVAVARSMIAVTALAAALHPDAGRVGRLIELDRGRSPVSAWRRTMLLLVLINVLLAFEVSIGYRSRPASALVVVVLGAVLLIDPLRGVARTRPSTTHPAVRDTVGRSPGVGQSSESLLHEELAAALIDDGLDLHYQPIVDVVSGRVAGAEALLRWDHPRGLSLTPPMVLTIAESGRFGEELERWIMTRALRDSLELGTLIEESANGSAESFVSINISTAQLEDPEFAAAFITLAKDHGVDTSTMVLELTEHDRLKDWSAAGETMTTLQAAGVAVALDDFGSGRSNVEILARLRFDVVKLDQTFSAGAISRQRRALLESSVHAVRSLDVQLILEGVELKDVAWSRALLPLVDLVQGYAYGVPMPLDEFARFLEAELRP